MVYFIFNNIMFFLILFNTINIQRPNNIFVFAQELNLSRLLIVRVEFVGEFLPGIYFFPSKFFHKEKDMQLFCMSLMVKVNV